jgi:pimeloyl-ACP methyl ester carboxylesterase
MAVALSLLVHSPGPSAQAAKLSEAHVTVPGARIAYLDSGGTGPAVVLLHAFTGSSRVWEHQVDAFTAAGLRLIAYDRRGYGKTAIVPGAPPTSPVEELRAFADALRLGRFHAVGTAAGGGIALGFALAYPERLRSVVVANSLGGVQDPEYLEMNRRLRPAEFESWPADFRELGPSYRAANPEGTRRWLELEKSSRSASADEPRRPVRVGAPAPPRGNAVAVTFARLASLTRPLLLLTGDADLYTPPSVLRMFAQRIPGSEAIVIAESGHSAYWEQPDAFNRAVVTFLEKH